MINLNGTILAQYTSSPILMAWLALINQSIDPSQGPGGATPPYLTSLKTNVWGAMATATPEDGGGVTFHYGFDVWGRIVGVGRNLFIPASVGTWFGFNEAQTGGPTYLWTGFGDALPANAVLNATVSGTNLTVNSLTSGTIEVGQVLIANAGGPYLTGGGAIIRIVSGAGSSWVLSGTPGSAITGISITAGSLPMWDSSFTSQPSLGLTNTQMQQMILAKAYANISSASSYALNIVVRKMFGARVCVYDNGNMGMSVNFESAPTTDQSNLINYGNVLPHASGVLVGITTGALH